METTFVQLVAPLQKYFSEQGASIDNASDSRKLFFEQFTLTILYAFIMQIPSLRKISNKLLHNSEVEQLGLSYIPFTTLRDGFTRFTSQLFAQLYRKTLEQSKLLWINALDEFGLISLVDGSLFPTLSNMEWAEYKTTKNAIRLQMEFGLNLMVPTEFIGQMANASERSFLLSILRKGVTYIADRGYCSFEVFAHIENFRAFFIIRIKDNMKFVVGSVLNVSGQIPACLTNVRDQLVRFDNDPHQKIYRIVCFRVQGSTFTICTNRLDLTTLQIIMLYAYRWQIELLFKFIKRTINGIHLFTHSQNGVNVQFCLLMILSVLFLNLKQFCKIAIKSVKVKEKSEPDQPCSIEKFNTYLGACPQKWINTINKAFEELWKISSYWLENLKDLLCKPFDYQIISALAQDD